MIVFEIITPGTRLDYPDSNWAWKIQGQLDSLKSHFFEANSVLNLFSTARLERSSFASHESWERNSKRRREIRRAIEQELEGSAFRADWNAVNFEADVRFKREKWSNGGIPREFEHGLPFIYARAFLYALDAFDKFLGVLAKQDGVPEQLTSLHAQIADAFPHLRGVRNTAQHLEDRARGLGAGSKPQPLDLKPIENSVISAPGGGVLILSCLNGSKYGSTMSDGHYGEIDVSAESMQTLQRILEGVLQAFKWRGPRQHAPNA